MNNLKKMKMNILAKSSYGMFIILILGLTITAFFYISESNSVEQRINSAIKESSLERIQAIKQELYENLNINIAIAALYQASNEVTREEFSIFVSRYFDTHADIQALEWIPIVQSSEKEEFIKRAQDDGFADFQFREKNQEGEMVPVEPRAEYYPVYYVEPLSGNEKVLGYDLGSSPVRLDAISKAMNSGKLTVTARINLVQKSNIEYGILVFEPIYENRAKGQINRYSQVTEGTKLTGFALGVYSVHDLLTSALSEYPDVGLDITLYDLSVPSGSEILTAINDLEDNQDLAAHPSLSTLKEGVHYSRSFAVADRTWELVFTPRKRFLEAIPDNSKFILISGLFMSLVIMISYRIIFVNVAEGRKTQLKYENIAKELRQYIETANTPIFGVDIDGCVNEWNQMAEKLSGYKKKDIIGKTLLDEFITEDLRESIKEVFVKALNGQETSNFEFPFYTKKGERVIILLSASSRRDIKGKIIGVIGIGQDITENIKYRDHLEDLIEERTKTLAESLSETEEARDQIDGILKSVADGLVVTDLNNRVIMMNRAAEDLFGVRFSEVANRSIDFAIKDKTLRDRIKLTLQKKTTGYSFDFEWGGENDSADILRARTSVILDKHGRQTGIITIFHNVTLEREIDRMKSEFISMAAHELRTPLTSIRGFSEILLTRDDLKKSDKTKYLTYIQDQSEVLSEIISDLLDISRIEAGKGFVLQKKNCMVGDAIKQITEPYIHQLPKKSIRVHLPEKEIELFLDKEKMAQVLENLLSNAVKYSQEKVDIDITGEIKGDYYHVIMEDKGIGMTPEQLEKIYDKFYRADTSNTRITGTGLGMSIAKAIVEAHDGELWVESEFGKGTKVTFSVPINNMEGNIKFKSKKAVGNLVLK
ncbi:MAG: CHASE domain-containing protein [Candidatus Marinimicrobia bacterium]|nr:CHASE domain-containing protein [Candidatus Neomarinimicrobiota bacterium]